MQKRKYTASGVKWSFWLHEAERTAELLNKGWTFDRIRTACKEENLYDASTPARGEMIFHTVRTRLKLLMQAEGYRRYEKNRMPDDAVESGSSVQGAPSAPDRSAGQSRALNLFLTSGLESRKLMNLTGILLQDSLLFDFTYEVIREKIIMGTELAETDFRQFFNEKQVQSDIVAKWTEPTIRRLTWYYRTILSEAGVITSGSGAWKVRKAIPDKKLEQFWKSSGLDPVYRALTGA